jgi:galactonate dehydratase
MMLKDVRTFVVGNPPPHYGGPYFVFVKLVTDQNVSGIGEAYGVPFDPQLVARMLEDVFDRFLRGQDPHDIENLWRRVYSARYTQHPDLALMGGVCGRAIGWWVIKGQKQAPGS